MRVLFAAMLGVAAAALVSCGSSNKLIPVASAGSLQGDFEEVQQAAEGANGDCAGTEGALLKTEQDYKKLPSSVDAGLRDRMHEGIEKLRQEALSLCNQQTSSSSTTSSTKSSTTPKTTTTKTPTTTTTTTETQTTPSTPSAPTTTPSTGGGTGGGTTVPEESAPGVGAGGGTGAGEGASEEGAANGGIPQGKGPTDEGSPGHLGGEQEVGK